MLARLRGLGAIMVEVRRAISEGTIPPAMIDGLAFAWVNRHVRAGDDIRLTGRSQQTTTRDLAAAVEGAGSGDRREARALLRAWTEAAEHASAGRDHLADVVSGCRSNATSL